MGMIDLIFNSFLHSTDASIIRMWEILPPRYHAVAIDEILCLPHCGQCYDIRSGPKNERTATSGSKVKEKEKKISLSIIGHLFTGFSWWLDLNSACRSLFILAYSNQPYQKISMNLPHFFSLQKRFWFSTSYRWEQDILRILTGYEAGYVDAVESQKGCNDPLPVL